jgi:hypothetical protein
VRTAVAEAWAAAPALPRHWSVDRAEGAMAAMGRHLLATHCPPGAAAPRKPWITEATFALLMAHAHERRVFFDMCGLRTQARLLACLEDGGPSLLRLAEHRQRSCSPRPQPSVTTRGYSSIGP